MMLRLARAGTERYQLAFARTFFSNVQSGGQTDTTNHHGKIPPPQMAVTVLSGFLGAGKTTFLHHVLSSHSGSSSDAKKRYGLIVNDMASINIDAKLLRVQTAGLATSTGAGIDTLELQNGCVCCTLAEDLMDSVNTLVRMSAEKGLDYDHIVVECSGIAEPRKIRDLFHDAEMYAAATPEYSSRVKLDTLITIVDASVFFDLFGSNKNLDENSGLVVRSGDEAGQVMLQDGVGQRRVTDLLLEQVECADIVLVNKCDLLAGTGRGRDQHRVELVTQIVRAINPTCRVYSCVHGELENAISLLGSAKGAGAASGGILEEHRHLVASAAAATTAAVPGPALHTHSHTHHDHHDHHDHQAASSMKAECSSRLSHDHSHEPPHTPHVHAHDSACVGPTCTDPTHHHTHTHTHDHAHGHEHRHITETETTAKERFGITSFAFKRRRPFHPLRFGRFLRSLNSISVKSVADVMPHLMDSAGRQVGESDASDTAISHHLLRCKGFVWMATSASAAYFMSHAGQCLDVVALGRWWADIDRSEWPPASIAEIEADFSKDQSVGDRRQEIVFIGQFGNADAGTSAGCLERLLDTCLLTDSEFEEYRALSSGGDTELRKHYFPQAE